jgi:hypothetical protein
VNSVPHAGSLCGLKRHEIKRRWRKLHNGIIICILHYILSWLIKEWDCWPHEEIYRCIQNLDRICEGREQLGRPRH